MEVGEPFCRGTYVDIYRAKKDGYILIKGNLRLPGLDTETDPLDTLKEFKDYYQQALKFLQENFQEYLPDTQLVWGRGKGGQECGYILTEEVIEETDKAYEEQKFNELDEFLSSAIKIWLENKDDRGCARFPDLKGRHNYIFGRTKKKPIPKLYLVDAFPVERLSQRDIEKEVKKVLDSNPDFNFPQTSTMLQEIENAESGENNIDKRE